MGGTIAVSIKLRDEQQSLLQAHYSAIFPGIEIPKSIHFTSWTNWITWIIQYPDMWLSTAKDTILQERINDQTTLKIIFDNVLEDNIKEHVIQKYPNPISYGIMCLDLENKQIYESQGYARPGKMYLNEHSTARTDQLQLLRLAANAGLVAYVETNSYTREESLKYLQDNKLPFASITKAGTVKHYFGAESEIPNDPSPHLRHARILITASAFMKIADIIKPNTAKPNIFRIFPNMTVHFKTGKNGIFTIQSGKEPCSKSEVLKRLKEINKFLKINNWPDELPTVKLNLPDPENGSSDVSSLFIPLTLISKPC